MKVQRVTRWGQALAAIVCLTSLGADPGSEGRQWAEDFRVAASQKPYAEMDHATEVRFAERARAIDIGLIEVLSYLQNESLFVWRKAVEVLLENPPLSPAVLRTLPRCMTEYPNHEVRREIALVVAHSRVAERVPMEEFSPTIETLKKIAIEDPVPSVRMTAHVALVFMTRMAPWVVEVDISQRAAAVSAYLRHEDLSVRRGAMRSLSYISGCLSEAVVDLLAERAFSERDSWTRQYALELIFTYAADSPHVRQVLEKARSEDLEAARDSARETARNRLDLEARKVVVQGVEWCKDSIAYYP